MGGNTLRALASDLGYLEGWCNLATGFPLPWPAPESLLLKFVAHHLWDPVKRARIRTTACCGRGGRVARSSPAGSKKPHAPNTMRRRLTSWSNLTRWRGLQGCFDGPRSNPRCGSQCARARDHDNEKARRRSRCDILAKAAAGLRWRAAGRSARPGPASGRFRVWRAAAIRSRGIAGRGSRRRRSRSCRSERYGLPAPSLPFEPPRPHKDDDKRRGRACDPDRPAGIGTEILARRGSDQGRSRVPAQLDQMGERPVRGGKKWQPSSVRDLVDEAHPCRNGGAVPTARGSTRPTSSAMASNQRCSFAGALSSGQLSVE